jgi:hypothetical protein
MALTHILVDFDNVKPSAADIALVRGENLRLAVVRGAQQTRYEADLAEALHALADRVTFTRCAKSGKNAADMQIAYHLGELVHASPDTGARFVVISKDKDFDALLAWLQGRGVDATRAPNFKAALGGKPSDARPAKKAAEPRAAVKTTEPRTATKAAQPRAAKAARPKAAAPAPAAAEPARKTARPAARRGAALVSAPPAEAAAPAPAAPRKAAHAAARSANKAPDLIARAIEALQAKGAERPGKRKGLERFLESHLGRKFEPGALDALIDALAAEGVVHFDGNKVDYRLTKARR